MRRLPRDLALSLVLALGACESPGLPPLCQVPGELGAGAFTAHDCKDEPGCLDGWRFAARSVETMIFCPAEGREVTEIVSSDPSVMIAAGPLALAPGQVSFDLAAGAPGDATLELRGPGLVERLTLTVEDIAAADIDEPARVVVGGDTALTSTKVGVSGAPLFGRGGYGLTVPAGVSTRPATTGTRDCGLLQPDIVVRGDEVGSYAVGTDRAALPWTGTIEVVPRAAVTSVDLFATRITGTAEGGYGAYVRVLGRDAAGRPVHGVTCAWDAPRPVFIASDVCWSLVLMSTAEPLELTCAFDGRALGTVRLTTALAL